jgi:hypothetical protein
MNSRVRLDQPTGTPPGNTYPEYQQRLGRIITLFCGLAILLTMVPAVLAQCAPPPTGTMVAWYPLDTYGVNVATRSREIRSAVLPYQVVGEVNFALGFDGVDTYVGSPDSILTNFGPARTGSCTGGDFSSCSGDFSIEAWVNLQGHRPSLPEAIMDKRGPGPIGYSFYIDANRIGLQLADGTGPVGYDNYDSRPVAAIGGTNWHHVAVTVNRAKAIHWFVDGVAHGSTVPAHTGSLVNTASLIIGANGPDNPGGFFNGWIDEVSLYNRALTAAEVKAIYTAGPSGKCGNIYAASLQP